MVGVVNLVLLRVLRTTTKITSTFLGKKSAPPEKILAMPMYLITFLRGRGLKKQKKVVSFFGGKKG